jgi:hypothetical protein
MRTYLNIDDKLKPAVDVLKERLVTTNLAYIVRLAVINLSNNFFLKNIDTSISFDLSSLAPAIADLPGMDLDIVESHFVRFRKFRPTVEVYRAAVEAVKADAAAKGEPVRNPEAALYGKMKAWTLGKWRPGATEEAEQAGGGMSRREFERQVYGA